MAKVYTPEEVVKHNHEKDLWIVYKGGVYDITKFLQEHPGGEEVLLDMAGQDATKCFDEIGHSGEAIQLRETYKIGTVDGIVSGQSAHPAGAQPEKTTEEETRREMESTKRESSPAWPIAIAAIFLAVYVYAFHY